MADTNNSWVESYLEALVSLWIVCCLMADQCNLPG